MKMTFEERFRSHFVAAPNGCWVWTGFIDRHGYGRFRVEGRVGKTLFAHRVSYELFVGPIPAGLQIDHLCRNHPCVNPRHLEPVTQKENCLRGESPFARNFRKTACINGHPFSEENTYARKRGGRDCKTCNRLNRRRRDEARRRLTQ